MGAIQTKQPLNRERLFRLYDVEVILASPPAR